VACAESPRRWPGPGRQRHLFDGPRLPGRRIAAFVLWGESIEQGIVSWVDGDELPLQVRGQFGDLHAVPCQHAGDVVTVGLASRRFGKIEDMGRAGWQL
jgi:hypothetical protein